MKKGHRGRSPVRLTLPVTEWPAGDLQLWHAAQTPAGPFCPNSPAVTWSPARRHIVEDAYGQWLQWLTYQGRLAPESRPGARATPEKVLDYVIHLDSRMSEVSVAMMIGALVRMLAVLEPKIDRAWLRAGYQHLKLNAKPSRNKRAAWVPIKDLYDLGIRIMQEAEGRTGRVDYAATQYRDGLLVSFLAALPIRIKNFSTIELGTQLVWRNGAYWLVLTEDETKNGRPYEAPLPDHLAPHLEHYLKHYRRLQLEAGQSTIAPTTRLWLNRWGEAMDSSAIRFQIKDRTRRAFGHNVWPQSVL